MHCVANIHDDLYWLGASDRRLAKFENVFPVPRGVSYNSYLVLDEKTVLMDTVDKAVGERFFENLEFALAGRPLDYVVVNHMEPDHCATPVSYTHLMESCPDTIRLRSCQFFDNSGRKPGQFLSGDTVAL